MRTKDEIIKEILPSEDSYRYDNVEKAMEEYAKPYKTIADLISRIYFYGKFKAETPAERDLEKVLTEVGLWPTTEDEIIKRDDI